MRRPASIDRRSWILTIAILLVSAACTSQGTPSPGDSSTESSRATVSPTASPSRTALPKPVVAGAWERVPDQPSLRAVQLLEVVWTGTRFVATPGYVAQFLDSVDGQTWNLQGPSWPSAFVAGIATGTRGIVAFGQLDDRAATWYSSDGLMWALGPDEASLRPASPVVPSPTGAFVARMRMNDVTETDDGWLAVGEEYQQCQIDCATSGVTTAPRTVLWTSADGIHWMPEPDSPSFANARVTGVTRGGPGFVAVGGSFLMPSAAVVWTSVDGRSWSRVEDAPVFHAPPGTDQTFGAGMSAVTTGRDGTLVAVGTVGTQGEIGSALAWWSSDGQTWTAGIGDRFLYGQLFNVAVTPTGFLATGPSGGDSCLGGIWSSTDGRSWRCVAEVQAFADFAAYVAAGSSNVEVVVGFGPPFSLPGGAPSASVWVRSVR